LRQTDMSVLEVGLACGFDSASYFSRCYRKRFAASPNRDRHERPDTGT
jgi:AraC family carnitine catabolism transcriptional activator